MALQSIRRTNPIPAAPACEDMHQTSRPKQTQINYRPLGVVRTILEGLGAEISYVYEDLVFVTHNHFLLQFGEVGRDLFFYQNTEIDDDDSRAQFQTLEAQAHSAGMQLSYSGKYSLRENDDGTISIEFSR